MHLDIDSVDGSHDGNKTNDDVKGLNIFSIKKVKFFPKNVEKFFKNLIGIQIWSSQLDEIKQSDLKSWPLLKYLFLSQNNIKFLEKDLFRYNNELKTIWLSGNQISYIDPDVFDSLKNLQSLRIDGNKCKTSFERTTTKSIVQSQIKRLKSGECNSVDVFFTKIKMLEVISKNYEEQQKKFILHETFSAGHDVNKTLVKQLEVSLDQCKSKNDNLDNEVGRLEKIIVENARLCQNVIKIAHDEYLRAERLEQDRNLVVEFLKKLQNIYAEMNHEINENYEKAQNKL